MPHRDFLETVRTEKSDITLQALCDRPLSERGVKADTSMMSRFGGERAEHRLSALRHGNEREHDGRIHPLDFWAALIDEV
jgi:hypothetical protein